VQQNLGTVGEGEVAVAELLSVLGILLDGLEVVEDLEKVLGGSGKGLGNVLAREAAEVGDNVALPAGKLKVVVGSEEDDDLKILLFLFLFLFLLRKKKI